MSKSNRLYVSNLDMQTNEDDLKKLFSKFGIVKELTLKEKHNYKFCFIELEDQRDAETALKEYI